ncbi:MAG: sigma-70 family RNA polymerase sigma factor [Pirellulaceae bacterium]
MAQHDRQTDTSLIRLLQESRSADPQRWKDCLGRFYEQYYPAVFAWCRLRGLKEQDALDVSHDLMVDIGRKLKNYSAAPGRRFSDWLFVVTRNAVHDHARREARRRAVGGDALDAALLEAATESGDLIEKLTAAFEQEIKFAALAHVERNTDELNRRIIELRFRQGLSGGEVAERLGIQPNALYQRVRRLRKELDRVKNQFEEEGTIFMADELSPVQRTAESERPPGERVASDETNERDARVERNERGEQRS